MSDLRCVPLAILAVLAACGDGSDDDGSGTDDPAGSDTDEATGIGDTDEPGEPLPTISQRFAHPAGITDLLFVLDTSASMAVVQADVAQHADVLFEVLDGVDYHVGVVAMDMEDPQQSGRLRPMGARRWIDPASPTPSDGLGGLLSDTSGSDVTQGREAAYSALELLAGGPNQGFARPLACTLVVSVTDADDLSGDDLVSSGAWLGFLRALEETRGPVAHHVLAPSVSPLPTYESVTTGIGGERSQPDEAGLTALAEAAQCLPRTTFVLWRDADPATITVSLDREGGTPRPVEAFTYDAPTRTLTLDEPPLHADIVVVSFAPL